MHAPELFAVLSGLILAIGGPPYFIDILKGKTKPQRTTWFIWSILGIIAFISQVQLRAHWSLVFAGFDSAGSLAVFILSLKYGVGGWSTTDKIALGIAAAGIVMSIVFNRPFVALFGVILADISGAVLTIQKTYKDPGSETTISWIFIGISSVFGALAVGKIVLGLLLYPIYLAGGNFAVATAIYLGRMAERKKSLTLQQVDGQ